MRTSGEIVLMRENAPASDGAGKTAIGRKQKLVDVSVTAKSMTAVQVEKIVTDGKGNVDA